MICNKNYKILADKIFIDLIGQSFCYSDSITWLTTVEKSKSNDSEFIFRNVSLNFYDGISGILFFLFAYNKSFPSSLSKSIYIKAINTFLKRLNSDIDKMDLGFHNGISGVKFILDIIKDEITVDEYNKANSKILLNTINKIEISNEFDIISGICGFILYIIKHSETVGLEFIQLLPQAINKLKVRMIEKENYIVFKNNKNNLLGGFSHGVSGVAYCFLLLSEFYKNDEYLEYAEKCLKYELTLFDEVTSNFIDMRLNYKGFCNYWCHGYPGISITLSKAYSITKREYYLDYIKRSYEKSALDIRNLKSLCLCHGVYGNLALLEEINVHLDCDENLEEIKKYENFLLDNFNNNEVYLKFTEQKYIPGLMTGISGIGLFALKKYSGNNYLSYCLY